MKCKYVTPIRYTPLLLRLRRERRQERIRIIVKGVRYWAGVLGWGMLCGMFGGAFVALFIRVVMGE